MNSGPLSITISRGLPYSSIARSSARLTRMRESDVSTSSAGQSFVNSSTIVSTRIVLPSQNWSETKSIDQRSLAAIAAGSRPRGARAPCLRRLLRSLSPSAR